MAISDLVAAAKAKILLRNKQTIIDTIQVVAETQGAVTVNGDGSVTVDGRNLNNSELIAVADVL